MKYSIQKANLYSLSFIILKIILVGGSLLVLELTMKSNLKRISIIFSLGILLLQPLIILLISRDSNLSNISHYQLDIKRFQMKNTNLKLSNCLMYVFELIIGLLIIRRLIGTETIYGEKSFLALIIFLTISIVIGFAYLFYVLFKRRNLNKFIIEEIDQKKQGDYFSSIEQLVNKQHIESESISFLLARGKIPECLVITGTKQYVVPTILLEKKSEYIRTILNFNYIRTTRSIENPKIRRIYFSYLFGYLGFLIFFLLSNMIIFLAAFDYIFLDLPVSHIYFIVLVIELLLHFYLNTLFRYLFYERYFSALLTEEEKHWRETFYEEFEVKELLKSKKWFLWNKFFSLFFQPLDSFYYSDGFMKIRSVEIIKKIEDKENQYKT